MTEDTAPAEAAPPGEAGDDLVGSLVAGLDARSLPRLGRSLALFPLAAGDCGGCALEWAILRHVAGSLAARGLPVQDTPVGADVLLVTGAMTRSLAAPVRRALLAMAEPRWVVAVGDCAIDGGPFAASTPVAGGVDAAIPVDLVVPGCPPRPEAILVALQALLDANGN